jgi:hypothetical protein
LLKAGQEAGEFRLDFAPRQVAAAIVAVVQGAYVLAKAAQSSEPFDDAIAGAVALLGSQRAEPTPQTAPTSRPTEGYKKEAR